LRGIAITIINIVVVLANSFVFSSTFTFVVVGIALRLLELNSNSFCSSCIVATVTKSFDLVLMISFIVGSFGITSFSSD
jgi:hypothetical protein